MCRVCTDHRFQKGDCLQSYLFFTSLCVSIYGIVQEVLSSDRFFRNLLTSAGVLHIQLSRSHSLCAHIVYLREGQRDLHMPLLVLPAVRAGSEAGTLAACKYVGPAVLAPSSLPLREELELCCDGWRCVRDARLGISLGPGLETRAHWGGWTFLRQPVLRE